MKKLFYVIGFPLLFVVSQFFMTIIATIIFTFSSNHSNIENYIETEEYTTYLAHFLSDYALIILGILFFIFFPILYKKYHNEVRIERQKISCLNFIFLVILGISFSLLYNSILGSINYIYPITGLFEGKPNLLIGIIGTVIIGPILEEYLFRGIVYHRLQTFFPVMKSLLLTGVIFALFHQNIFDMIYAFIFNFILIFSYERFSNIRASMVVHMSANLASLLFFMISQSLGLIEFTIFIASMSLILSYRELNR